MQVQGRTGALRVRAGDVVNIPRSETLGEHRLDQDVLVVEQQHVDCYSSYISGAVELLKPGRVSCVGSVFKCRGWGRDR